MKLSTQLFHNTYLRIILCWLAALLIRLVWVTGRWRTVGAQTPTAFWDKNQPFILAFWHGRLMMMPYCWRREKGMNMLISQHRDGELIARTIGHFGVGAVRGSSAKPGKRDKGGGGALRAMIKQLSRNEYVGVTPDGPRGPAQCVGDGILSIARLSGAPVIPVSFGTSRRIHARSWDRFLIALPFSRGVFVWGNSHYVPRNADAHMLEQARQSLEDDLNRITKEADALSGYPSADGAA